MKKGLKLGGLKLENFGKFNQFSIEFNDKLTHLIGYNGDGKTTVGLTAIWATLKGIAERSSSGQLIGIRENFIGQSKKTANTEITLIDPATEEKIKITNTISKAGNKITVKAPPGYKIDNEWLNGLLSVAFMSAKNFAQTPGKDQALLLGIDTSEYDKKISDIKLDAKVVRASLAAMGTPEPVEKVDRVSSAELDKEKDRIQQHNTIQINRINDCNRVRRQIDIVEEEILKIEKEYKEAKAKHDELNNRLNQLPEAEDTLSFDEVQSKIDAADEINKAATAYEQYAVDSKKREAKERELQETQVNLGYAQLERDNHIKSFDFGFDGLSVNDRGELLLNGRHIREPMFSRGELEMIVAQLHASMEPTLKVRFIDDFEVLDPKNQEKILTELLEAGFQVITAEVGDKAKKDNTIVLRECAIANDEPKGVKKKTLL
jgi:hypothetical protein